MQFQKTILIVRHYKGVLAVQPKKKPAKCSAGLVLTSETTKISDW